MPLSASPYPSIADYGLIGDCRTAALVSREGSIDWCCLPRFDSGSAFARLLDSEGGGHCSISPIGRGWDVSREYLEDTLVLATTFQGPGGEFRVLDCFLLDDRAGTRGRGETDFGPRILRVIEGRRGTVKVDVRVAIRFDYGAVRPWIRRHGQRLYSAIGGNDGIVVWCEEELQEEASHDLVGRMEVQADQRIHLWLAYAAPERLDSDGPADPRPDVLDRQLKQTVKRWKDWVSGLRPAARDDPALRRSAIALKALTYSPTGAIVAAPTTSLPEVPGGPRNWDYRYSWVRDSSFSSRAFAELGCQEEAEGFRRFIMRSAAGHAEDLQVVYGVGGERRLGAEELDHLEGYRGARPVRVGNQAASQRQLDALGEIVNLSYRWHRRGHSPTDDEWRFLVSLIDHAAEQWSSPDNGIWEWPGKPQHFVHSKVMCWAALDRGLRLAEECMRRAPTRRWKRARDQIRRAVERRGFDRKRGVFVQAFDRTEVDAALLLLPMVEFVAWDDERMVRTVAAIREDLDAGDGLLYRYRRRDGLRGKEGAFLCCSFWLVECLAHAGQLHEAHEVYEKTMARANDLTLFSEEFDGRSGEPLGNFPQGLTHLSHIDAAVALDEARRAA
ncbi:MAG: glycoside hydrolase family 15 protein [Solirubrobacteraceae bacterium]